MKNLIDLSFSNMLRRRLGSSDSQPERYMVDAASGINQTAWIRGWLTTLRQNYSANAFYIDTFGRGFEGSAKELLPLFAGVTSSMLLAEHALSSFISPNAVCAGCAGRIFPPNSITEGWVDFVPYATLIDGYNVGWGWVSGPGHDGDSLAIDHLRPFGHNTSG